MELDTSSIVDAVRGPLEKMGIQLLVFVIIFIGTYLICFLLLKAIKLPYKIAHFFALMVTFFVMYKSWIYIFIESHIS